MRCRLQLIEKGGKNKIYRKGGQNVTVVGMYKNRDKATLHVTEDFADYYSNTEAGRICSGKMAKSIYVGDMDVSGIKVGSEIEIYYGEAISTKNGIYSPIRKIEIVK